MLRGNTETLNAEDAKVTQRAQKNTERNTKLVLTIRTPTGLRGHKNIKTWLFFWLFLCVLCETFATSAFKKVLKIRASLQISLAAAQEHPRHRIRRLGAVLRVSTVELGIRTMQHFLRQSTAECF